MRDDRDDDRMLACGDDVQGGLIAAMGRVDQHAELVHPPHHLPSKIGEPAIPGLP